MASLFVNELTVIDFSFLDNRRGIVGESFIVDVVLNGDLNDEGMVFDFGLVKKQIKQAIDEGVDHKLVIPMGLPGLTILTDDEDFHCKLTLDQGDVIDYQSPREAVYLLQADSLNIAALTDFIEQHLSSLVPLNVTSVKIRLYPQALQGPYYHYSHGLKKHQGDCQRICHGHRSPIYVERNQLADEALATEIAELWQDIYLITREDIISQSADEIHLGYTSDQGRFELKLPARLCYVMETDTTVELIADHLHEWLQGRYPTDQILVQAFEGFKKGAIAASD